MKNWPIACPEYAPALAFGQLASLIPASSSRRCLRCGRGYLMGRSKKAWCVPCRSDAGERARARHARRGGVRQVRNARRRMMERLERPDQTRFAARLEDGFELQELTERDDELELWWPNMFWSIHYAERLF